MCDDLSRQCYAAALERARQRIDRDVEAAADDGVAAMLRFLRERPFDTKRSDVDAAVAPSKATHHRFKDQVGTSFMQYVSHQVKRPIAEWLLTSTELESWRIALLLGFASSTRFCTAFERWTGLIPSEVRGSAATSERCEASAEGLRPEASLALWLRASAGGLEAAERQQLWSWITQRLAAPEPGSWLAQFLAALPAGLAGAPWPEQVAAVQGVSVLGQPRRLFDAFCAQIIPASRQSRRRGVELARLALASLEANEVALGPQLADLRTLGEARLGNALRLAHDLDEAEAAFARAEQAWATPRSQRDPQVETELRLCLGTFRFLQDRFAEAREQLDRAVALGRGFGPPRLLAQSLLHRGTLVTTCGQVEEAVLDFREALETIDHQEEPVLALAAQQDLATDLVKLGRLGEAEVVVASARRLCASLAAAEQAERAPLPATGAKLDWIEARIRERQGDRDAAATLFRQARTALAELDLRHEVALLSLDWAELALEARRPAEAASLAAAALPVFDAFQLHPKAAATAQLLRKAIAANTVSRRIVDKARAALEATFKAGIRALPASRE